METYTLIVLLLAATIRVATLGTRYTIKGGCDPI